MKTSAVLVSALLSAFAVAAPVDKRALVYHTEIVTETVVVYTTVYDDDFVPEATATSEGYFYEQPEATSSAVVVPTSSAAPAPKVEESSSTPAPVPQTPTPTPSPSATPTPTPAVEQPKEEPKPTTSAYVAPAPAPVASSAAPVVASPSPVAKATTGGTTTGETFSNVDMTVYDNNGGFGACGTALYDTDFIAALSKDAWGASTYDVMTGAATNPWCGQKIQVEYNGNTVEATIMDLCPGCSGHDIDLSWAAWKEVTKTSVGDRYKASWSKIA